MEHNAILRRKVIVCALCLPLMALVASGHCDTEATQIVLGYGTNLTEADVGPGMRVEGESLRESTFIGVNLRNSNFENCDLSGSVFKQADVTGVSFNGCNLTDVQMDECNLEGASFENAVVNGLTAHLSPMQLQSTFSFRSGDMRKCIIVGGDQVQYRFGNMKLAGATFLGNMRKCDFTGADISDTTVSCEITTSQLTTTASYQRKVLDRVQLSIPYDNMLDLTNFQIWRSQINGTRVRLDNAFIRESRIMGIDQEEFSKSRDFRRKSVVNVDFNGADFSGFKFDGINLTGCTFFRCTLTDATFEDAVVSDVKFYSCKGLTREQVDETWNAKNDATECISIK